MAIKTKEEILSAVRDKFPDDASDEVISLIEDISDTYTDLETKAKGDGVDWKAKAQEIDEDWRKKYRDRFFSGKKDDEDEVESDEENPDLKKYNYEDLFTKE